MTQHTLDIDIETYCELDLTKVGVYAYAAHPSFRILMAAWSYDDGPVTVDTDPDAIFEIPGLWDEDVLKYAHNAQFERICFSSFYRQRTLELEPCEYLPPAGWFDTMAVAAEKGYPQNLEWLAQWLGGEQKDGAGTRLINLFSKPNTVKRGQPPRRVMPDEKPEEWEQFKTYCGQDVVTLQDVRRKLGDFPTAMERRVYEVDQRINDYGVAIDLEMVLAAESTAEGNAMSAEMEITTLTGVKNPGSRDQMLAWFKSVGHPLKDLTAETVQATIDGLEDGIVRQVLELRQELALVAAKKYTAARLGISEDERLRGQYRFFGAHTGRWAGRGVQLHNMPRESFTRVDPDTGKKVHDETGELAAIVDLKLGLGAEPIDLKRMVRPMILGPLTVVDYSAIEARVIAWLGGEEWALEAFRAGRDIYVETAQRMSTPARPLARDQGKVAVLALGYNGSVGSLQAMGAEGTEAQLKELVVQWRAANPSIVDLWAEMGAAFQKGGSVGDRLRIDVDGKDRALVLPSGRSVVYHDVRHRWVDGAFGRKLEASFADPKGHGMRTRTYGGRLTENATQAVARDILAEALVRLVDAGYRPVGHVHDEILVEGAHRRLRGDRYVSSVEAITEIMTEPPAWADGLPIDGEGFTCRRYRKG